MARNLILRCGPSPARNPIFFRTPPPSPAADRSRSTRFRFSYLSSYAIESIQRQPGVESVGASTLLPYGNIFTQKYVQPSGGSGPTGSMAVSYAATTPGYLSALGVRHLRGRDFTAAEANNSALPPVAIIDETLAKALFPGRNPIGRRIHEAGWKNYSRRPGDGLPPEFEIVGVCAAHRHDLRHDNPASLYVPYVWAEGSDHDLEGSTYLHVRYHTKSVGAIAAAVGSLRSALLAQDPDLPVIQIMPFTSLLDMHTPLWMARMGATLFGTFGLIALLLAAIGVYGVKAYAVSRRIKEIGIRLALGARRTDILGLFIKQGVLQIAVGLGMGFGLAMAAAQLLGTMIYHVSTTDPIAIVLTTALLCGAALIACYLPARRATKVDPMVALRAE